MNLKKIKVYLEMNFHAILNNFVLYITAELRFLILREEGGGKLENILKDFSKFKNPNQIMLISYLLRKQHVMSTFFD